MRMLKRTLMAALLLWAASALLYQVLLRDFEDHLLRSAEVVTGTFPGSEIAASLIIGGDRVAEHGTLVWGGTYTLVIHVASQNPIEGAARLNGFTIVDTASGEVLHRSDQVAEAAFEPDNTTQGSLAFINGPTVQLPFTDCTVRAELSLQTPWGTRDETVEIPFTRKVRTFRAVPFLRVFLSA